MATGKGKVKGKTKIWLFVILVIVMAIFYAKVNQDSNQQITPKHTIEKTGSGAVVDFTETTKKIHSAVDSALQKNQFSVRDTKEITKEIPRQKVEGTIRWHTRQVLVTVPADVSAEIMKQRMNAAIQSAGGQVLSTQPDTYQGIAVVRLDIGLRDKLDQEDITIISDRVYLTKEKGAALESISVPETKGEGKVRGKMALVIDDFGYNKESISAYAAINRPLTFAVIPYRPFSNEAAARGLSSGHQVILHLPMEPLDQGAQSEALTVTVAMSDKEIQEMVQKAIDTVPGLIGVNNHQGSRATADKRVMRNVLSVLKADNLFFVDSRTNGQSVAAETARQMGIQAGENELFIDNTNEVSAVKAKLRAAQEMAIKHGTVTVIGHARMTTATAVSEMIPELEAAGIQLVFVSQLLR